MWGRLSLALLLSYFVMLAKFCDLVLLYIILGKGKEEVEGGSSIA